MDAQTRLNEFNISMQEAHDWIMGNLNSPGLIYKTAIDYGIDSNMLAQIVNLSLNVNSSDVEYFFNAAGLDGNALRSEDLTNQEIKQDSDNTNEVLESGNVYTFSQLYQDDTSLLLEFEAGRFYSIGLGFDSPSNSSGTLSFSDPSGNRIESMLGINVAAESGIHTLDIYGNDNESFINGVIDYTIKFDEFGVLLNTEGSSPDSADDYFNLASQGTLIDVNSQTNGSIESRGDIDWLTVELIKGQTYSFLLEEVDAERSFTGNLSLWDQSGQDYGNKTDGWAFEHTADYTGYHHLEIFESGGNQTGSYSVTIGTLGASDILIA